MARIVVGVALVVAVYVGTSTVESVMESQTVHIHKRSAVAKY